MFNLVYASSAAKSFSDNELLDLLEQLHEKNARLGITGLLLHEEGSFMQALEGEEAVARERYDTIRKDARHQNVLTLWPSRCPNASFLIGR